MDFGRKAIKLAVLGLAVFAVVLVLVLFSTGFFNRSLPGRCTKDCPEFFLENIAATETKIVLSGDSFDMEKISVGKNQAVSLRILNTDNRAHRLLELYKNSKEGVYKTLKEYFIKPNEEKGLLGIANPEGQLQSGNLGSVVAKSGTADADTAFMFLMGFSDEYLISCTTCSGQGSQIKIILEK